MRRRLGLSIRARITVGSTIIAIVLFSVGVLVFRVEVQSILTETTTTLLRNDAAPLVTSIVENPADPIREAGEGQLIAVLGPDGIVVESTLPKKLAAELNTMTELGNEPVSITAGRSSYWVLKTTVMASDGEWTIISARNQEALGLLMTELDQVLFIGAFSLVAGFAIASWLLTGAALRPVNRLREEAESLSVSGSSAELLVPAGKDEVSQLAVTLNDFITRLRNSVDREKQVVNDASHELRTPLAVLRTQLELAHLNSGDAEALEQDIDDASATVTRLSRLATNLLELSKLESQQSQAALDWAGLESEITASVDRARSVSTSGTLEVAYEIAGDDADGHYMLSRTNVGQLVDNLISNAVAAMDGSGTVTVSLDRYQDGAILRTVDSGPGMPAEFLPFAFDRFSRPDDSRSSGTGGSGLGLAIVQAIVEHAGGSVKLWNTGSGLAVEIRLPRRNGTSL
ncbi:sensor histidine kinase [Leifsonia sp. A12D58]|uniref:sensor histidine kinase n=1 Tax=Leifsonia sp. A12D58 TaxID=3397674 RepID=UPI0039E04B5E